MDSKIVTLFHGPSWFYGCTTVAVHAEKLSAHWLLVIPIGIAIDLMWARYRQSKA